MKDIDWESLPYVLFVIIAIIGAVLIYNLINPAEASEELPTLTSEPIEEPIEPTGWHETIEVESVNEMAEVPDRPKKIIYSDEELMAMVVHAEAKGEEMVGKVAVASAILNRCDYYGLTVESVIYQEDQFAIATTYTESDMRAVEIAQEVRDLFPEDMLYFRNQYYHSFGTPYMQIGNHFFSTKGETK